MDLKDLLAQKAIAEQEDARLEGVEATLFSLDINEYPETPSTSDEEDTEVDVPKQVGLSPSGIEFFSQDMFTLYTEDTLVLPVQDSSDGFLSGLDESIVRDYITKGYLMREVKCSSKLVKYLFHMMCCTTDDNMRHMAYNSLKYLITTCDNTPYIKQELPLVLANLGGDMSLLPEDLQHCKSLVISMPPSTSPEAEAAQTMVSQLRNVLQLLMQFMSEWLIMYKNYTVEDVDDLLFVFIIISLDCKVIDNALDGHIGPCITNVLKLYSSDEELAQRMRDIVERIKMYCCNDLPSIVHLCEAYLCRTSRGKTLCGVIAFHHLSQHLRFTPEHFVTEVQAMDIADLLLSYFEAFPKVTDAYDAYYILKLVDLSLPLDYVQVDQKDALKTIHDLFNQKIDRSQGSADDLTPAITFQYLSATLSKWNSHYTRLAGVHEPL